MRIKSWAELKQLKEALKTQARVQAERKAQARPQESSAPNEQQLFRQTVGLVRPLAASGAQVLPLLKPKPVSLQRQRDEKAALKQSLSDAFDASTLLETDEYLSYRRTGLGPDVTRKLRRGVWAIQGQIDLHGLRSEQAREELAAFIRNARKQGLRCVRVIHGKGLGSPGKQAVLKSRVQSWLTQKNEVLAFVQARPAEGGAGALVVLLQPSLERQR